MTAAYTTPSDVFVPEVLGPVVEAYLYDNYALVGTGYVQPLDVSWNAGGNTATIRKFSGLASGFQSNAVDGTQVESTDLSVTSYTVKAVNKILSVAIDDVTMDDVATDVELQRRMVEQVGKEVQKVLDQALVTEAETTTLSKTCTGRLSVEELVSAKVTNWGDKSVVWDSCLVVHSKVYGDLVTLPQVQDSYRFGSLVAQTGVIPSINGMPIFVSDAISGPTNNLYTNLIVRRGALGYNFRKALQLEIKSEKGNTMKYWDFSFRYLVDLLYSNPLGVIKVYSE